MKNSIGCIALALVLASVVINAQQQPPPQSPPHPEGRPSSPEPPQQPAANQPSEEPQPRQNEEEIQLRCLAENGTVPHWLDNSCRTFLACVNYTLSLQSCEEDLVYSWPSQSCVAAEELNCTVQNENFADVIRAILLPHFYQNIPVPTLPLVPFFVNNNIDDDDGDDGTGIQENREEREEEEEKEGGMIIDLDDLPGIIVDNTNALNVTLPAETCQRLGGSVHQLEVSMNTALLMLAGCPQDGCDVPLFRIEC